MELGHSNYYQRVYLEHFEPKSISFESISQLYFNFEGGVKYAWMKEYYPREYELMKAFVKAGRWHVSGASWDATDTLVPSTESFIRNIMLGQEFYRKELGIESSDIFCPTVLVLAGHFLL